MQSTAEGEPVLPAHFRSLQTPRALETASTVSDSALEVQNSQRVRWLRHRLTSPEKKTVKRIQAIRADFFADSGVSRELTRARILVVLREDRGLKDGLCDGEPYEALSRWLVDDSLAVRTAAEVIGVFLRKVGAMERPELSAPRVKAALRVLNEALYAGAQDGPIQVGVREFRLEKRDGGTQIVGILRLGAREEETKMSARELLLAYGFSDVDVRWISKRDIIVS